MSSCIGSKLLQPSARPVICRSVIMAETNTANTQVFVKDFGTWILKYSSRSCDPAHAIYYSYYEIYHHEV